MTSPPLEHPCANHPHTPTAEVCRECGRPFCDACLAEFMGRRLCGWCRDTRLHRMQPARTVDPTAVVKWARIHDVVLAAGGAASSVFCGGYFSIPFWFGLGSGAGTATTPPSVSMTFGVMLAIVAGMAIVSLIIFLPPAVGLAPGRGYLWSWQIIACVAGILGGLSTWVVTAAPSVILLIYWVKPEVRAYCEGHSV